MPKLRKGWWIFLPVAVLAWFSPSQANADTYTTSGANDYYFEFSEPTLFEASTDAWRFGIDSMLWLFDLSGNVVAANDDYMSLDSFISVQLEPGVYRLRTSVCCGNPDAWYGTSYYFTTSSATVQTSSTTVQTESTPPTSEPEPTSTSTSPSTSVSPSTTETPATTLPQESSTTSSTVPPVESTTVPSPSETSSTSSTVPATSTSISPPVVSSVVPETVAPPPTPESTVPPPASVTTVTVPPVQTTITVATTVTSPTTVPVTTSQPTTTLVQVTTTLVEEPTEESVNIATSPEALQTLSAEQASELFSSIDLEEVTQEELKAIIDAVQSAPEEVRQAFEESVDIFGGGFDDYVPIGSNISVGARRVVVGVTAVLFIMPAPVVSSRRPGV